MLVLVLVRACELPNDERGLEACRDDADAGGDTVDEADEVEVADDVDEECIVPPR